MKTIAFVTLASLAPLVILASFDDITCARFPDADAVTVDEIERVK